MTIIKHDIFAIIPKRCDRCNRLFWLEPYNIFYKTVGIESYSLKQIECKNCIHKAESEDKNDKNYKKGTRQLATCEQCGCVFSYEEEDIKHLEKHDGNYVFADGTKHGYKNYVICPQCNTDFVVSQTRDFQ